MNASHSITIEENKRFSQSLIWEGQRNFYHEKGIDAWTGDVPFYITSNPFIANSYAKIVARFIQDWLNQNPKAKKSPFYIVELGAGSGQFSYYVIKQLLPLLKKLSLQDIEFCYIMTDFTDNNLKFWKEHTALKPFVEKGILDFAVLDIEQDETLTLENKQITLKTGDANNPLIVFANYLFDSIVNDVFYIKDNTIKETLVSLKTAKANIKNDMPKDWEKVVIKYEDQEIGDSYYQHDIFNKVLNTYKSGIKDTHLLFPIGSLRGLKNLNALSNNKMLLISSDKGYATAEELDELEFPQLDFHGSFSLMVNYHAIGNYFEFMDGNAFIQSSRDGLTSGVFCSGFKLDSLKETKLILEEAVENFSPSDYFNFYEHLEKTQSKTSLKFLASFLTLSKWDPYIFDQVCDHLTDLFIKEDDQIIDYIVDNLHKIADNFYYVPECEDILFNIGMLYYAIDHYDTAISYYKKSKEYFTPDFEYYYNTGLCLFYKEEFQKSKPFFQKALEIKPKFKDIKEMLRNVEKELSTT